jgi:cbb3-type cytochrome oxidase maturation protein
MLILTRIMILHAHRHLSRGCRKTLLHCTKDAPVIALFLVLFASLIVAGSFLGGFIWSVRKDQFEDREGAAMRMLFEEESPSPKGDAVMPSDD